MATQLDHSYPLTPVSSASTGTLRCGCGVCFLQVPLGTLPKGILPLDGKILAQNNQRHVETKYPLEARGENYPCTTEYTRK